MRQLLPIAAAVIALVAGCDGATPFPAASDARPTQSPSPTPSSKEQGSSQHIGFYPGSRLEDGRVVMLLTFVDGSAAEIVAPKELGVQDMEAAIYTAGGLGRTDRTIDFDYRNGSVLMDQGPLETYRGSGSKVEMWNPHPSLATDCPNLVYRFGDWFVGVRACQPELGPKERRTWARSLEGRVNEDGFLVLSSTPPLHLEEAGGHEGPEIILGYLGANWIELTPGKCDPTNLPDEGDIRTMSDGTRVSFSRIGGANSKRKDNWYVEWCEDGLMRVQVSNAYERFAQSAAEGLRLRNIVLIP